MFMSVDAVKVQFLQPIFEDDFPEKGMKAWLTCIKWENDCYKLFFDFNDFEEENDKYFVADYYDANRNPCLTAKDVGLYTPKYSVYFSVSSDKRDDVLLEVELKDYLQIID